MLVALSRKHIARRAGLGAARRSARNADPSSNGYVGRSPAGTAMLAALSRKHIARRAGLGAARRSARNCQAAPVPYVTQYGQTMPQRATTITS
jgi:hypothetical protein